MNSLIKASRINTALQVIQHMNDGMSVVEACRLVGMPRSSFYYIVENNPEAIAEVQAIIDANKREQLGLILMSKTEMLSRVIEDGLSPETKPRDRLAIYMKLDELADKVGQRLQKESETERLAQEFQLTGPKLARQRSTFEATQTTIRIETET